MKSSCVILLLFFFSLVASPTTKATGNFCEQPREGFSAIAHSAYKHERIRDNRFYVERGYLTYISLLDDAGRDFNSPVLKEAFEKLNASSHWLDVGCGTCRAINDFLFARGVNVFQPVNAPELVKKNIPRVTGMMISDDFSALLNTGVRQKDLEKQDKLRANVERLRALQKNADPKRVRVLVGTPVEEVSDPLRQIGKIDLITDIMGAAAYAPDLGRVFTRYGELLGPGKHAFIYFDSDKIIIRTRSKRLLSFYEYMWMTKGFTFDMSPTQLRLTRDSRPVYFPPLRLDRIDNSVAPPHRFYTIDID